MLQSTVAPLPLWVANQRRVVVVALLALVLATALGRMTVADGSLHPSLPGAVTKLSAADRAVARFVRQVGGRAARKAPAQLRSSRSRSSSVSRATTTRAVPSLTNSTGGRGTLL